MIPTSILIYLIILIIIYFMGLGLDLYLLYSFAKDKNLKGFFGALIVLILYICFALGLL